MMRMLVVTVFILGFILGSFFLGGLFFEPAMIFAANSSEGLSVDPIFQDLELENGKEVETVIYISNHTSEPQEVAISAIDIAQESLTGKLIFITEDASDYPHSLTPYMTFDKDRFIILPGATESLTIYVEDREGLKPGGHYAAVLVEAQAGISTGGSSETSAEDAEAASNTGNIENNAGNTDQTTVLPALASILFIKKTGVLNIDYQVQNLSGVKNLQTSFPKNIRAKFTNDGNSHITPRGVVRITGWKDRILSQTILNPNSSVLFPNTQRELNSPTELQQKIFPFEPLKLEFHYRDNSESELQVKTLRGFYIHPLLIIIGFVIILLLIIRRIRIFKKRKNNAKNAKK